ncbi:lipopolysaccharide biosynthesis protein [Desertivirga xinjiangensis]|uniref:lipopolysaccharide biosynthesis protein n=1 Tax=Desertivirga xinjiangensis TaxID=539206 RepID=UPI0021097E1D|nr:lipopolysaccharide biosynthesis protein [Pedobacter xinjiangensis]
MTLREKTIAGLLWSITEQFSSKLIGILISIFLARILAPAEFGLIAMLSVFISIGNSLIESGLTSSLIRTDNPTNEDFSTVFFFNLFGSIIIYGILFFSTPYIALFYRQEQLINIIRVYGISFIINALFTVQSARLTKAMNFKIQTLINIPSVIGGGITGLTLAYAGYGVWSLVWMMLCSSSISTLMYWIYSDWRPMLTFNTNSFKKHFSFGYKMTLSGILENIYRNTFVIIIGKYYSATQLGFYSRAESLSQLPSTNISIALGKVTYPMFASITHDNEKLKVVYKRVLQQVLFWNAPCLVLLCVIAEPLFAFLLTEKWLPAVPYFQILCIAGIMYPLHAYNLNILKVKGRSDLLLKLEFIKKTISVAGILMVIPFEIFGLLYFQLGCSFLFYFINSVYSGKIISYPVSEQIGDIFPTIGLSAITGLLCRYVDIQMVKQFNSVDIDRILIISLLYLLAYLSCSNMIRLTAITDFKHLILKK